MKQRIIHTPRYDQLAGIIEFDDSYTHGIEVERLEETRHRDGEVVIPLHPKRHK